MNWRVVVTQDAAKVPHQKRLLTADPFAHFTR